MHKDEENIQTIVERLGEYEKILSSMLIVSGKRLNRNTRVKNNTINTILKKLKPLQGKSYADLSDYDKSLLIQVEKHIKVHSPRQFSEIQSKKIQKSEQKSQAGGVAVSPGATLPEGDGSKIAESVKPVSPKTATKGSGSSENLDGNSFTNDTNNATKIVQKKEAANEPQQAPGAKSTEKQGAAEEPRLPNGRRSNRLAGLSRAGARYTPKEIGKEVVRQFAQLKEDVKRYRSEYYVNDIPPGGELGITLERKGHVEAVAELFEYADEGVDHGGGMDNGTGEYTQERINYLRKIGYTREEKESTSALLVDPSDKPVLIKKGKAEKVVMQRASQQELNAFYDGAAGILERVRDKGICKFDFIVGRGHYVAGALLQHERKLHLIMPDSMNPAVSKDIKEAAGEMAELIKSTQSNETDEQKKQVVRKLKGSILGKIRIGEDSSDKQLDLLESMIDQKGSEEIQRDIVANLALIVNQLERSETAAEKTKNLLLLFCNKKLDTLQARRIANDRALERGEDEQEIVRLLAEREEIEREAKIIEEEKGDLESLEIHESYDCLESPARGRNKAGSIAALQFGDAVHCGAWATKILQELTRERCEGIAACKDTSAMNQLIQTVANTEAGPDGKCDWTEAGSAYRAAELRIEQYEEIRKVVDDLRDDVRETKAEFSAKNSAPGHSA